MLYFETYNNNSSNWVVFLHGIGGSTKTWKRQIDDFKDYNLLLIDLPGHGQSKDDENITVSHVNYKIKEIMDYLNIEKADFVGLSLGTLVAAHFAIKYPTYVKNLIFGGCVIKVEGIYKFLMNTIQVIKNFMPHRILYRIMAKVMLPKKNHKKSRMIFLRESLKMSRKVFLSWVSYIAEIAAPDKLIEKLKNLKINIFFISGDEDNCFISGVKSVAKYLTKSKLYIIKKCGHVCSIEKSKEFNSQVINYLNHPVATGI